MCQALLEIIEPEINKIKKSVEMKTMNKGIRGTVTALRDCGHGDAEIKKAIIKVYGISIDEAESYL